MQKYKKVQLLAPTFANFPFCSKFCEKRWFFSFSLFLYIIFLNVVGGPNESEEFFIESFEVETENSSTRKGNEKNHKIFHKEEQGSSFQQFIYDEYSREHFSLLHMFVFVKRKISLSQCFLLCWLPSYANTFGFAVVSLDNDACNILDGLTNLTNSKEPLYFCFAYISAVVEQKIVLSTNSDC